MTRSSRRTRQRTQPCAAEQRAARAELWNAEAGRHAAHLHVGLVLVDFDNLAHNAEAANSDKFVHERTAHVGRNDNCGRPRQEGRKGHTAHPAVSGGAMAAGRTEGGLAASEWICSGIAAQPAERGDGRPRGTVCNTAMQTKPGWPHGVPRP